MFRNKIATLAAAGLIFGSLGVTSGCANPCADDGELVLCGDFGENTFTLDLRADEGVRWPAVATPEGNLLVAEESGLLQVGPKGETNLDPSLLHSGSAPSVGEDGTTYVITQNGSVESVGLSSGLDWSQQVNGNSTAAPPAISEQTLWVTVASQDRQDRTILALRRDTGDVNDTVEDGADPIIGEDGSITYKGGVQDCGAAYDAVVSEDAEGNERFRFTDESGIIDLAPGPDGEFYVVTGNRTLVRISNAGDVEWTFEPDCNDCTVAGAPTVTDDAVYFPVWQGVTANNGCNDGEGEFLDPEDGVDPLFALTRSGELKWSYDGFSTLARRYEEGGGAGGGLLFASHIPVAHHHPSGRPVVAKDGTLFVPSDGSVVALSPEGEELGYALYNPSAGELKEGDGGLLMSNHWINAGLSVPPVLDDNGQLYVWDGFSLRGFDTGKGAADIPWTAPFGGNTNAGQLGGR
jgi:hypothetical protein